MTAVLRRRKVHGRWCYLRAGNVRVTPVPCRGGACARVLRCVGVALVAQHGWPRASLHAASFQRNAFVPIVSCGVVPVRLLL